MSYRSKTAETGSALSIVDILTVLYFSILNIDPKKPEKKDRDRFILSKGHGAAALYAVLAERGYFKTSELATYRVDHGRFHGHPSRDAAPGIEVSTGSLGHGLSIAAGIALSLAKDEPRSKVFVLLGDGECNEGSIWEAAMFVNTLQLPNIIAIVDMNGFQGFGTTTAIDPTDLQKKFQAFGWTTLTVLGHDLHALEEVFNKAREINRPTVILAKTITGKGITEIEKTLLAHYYVVDENTYNKTR